MKVKEDNEKVGLKLNIQKMKIMSSNAITSWQIDGETMETVTDFIFLSSKIIADGNCSHKIKRHLLLGRKAMTNLGSILKSRDISLPTSQIYGFSSSLIWMLELDYKESWVPKNWCFWTMCWRRLLRVLWTAKRSNQSILKERSVLNIHWKDWCWSWNSNTWATWCGELTHWKRHWWLERLRVGEERDLRGWNGWIAPLTW